LRLRFFQVVQGFSERHSGKITNTGSASPRITLRLSGDLISGSSTLPASDVVLNVVGVDGTSFILSSGRYKNIDITVNAEDDQETGVYTGTIEIVDANSGVQYETAPIKITICLTTIAKRAAKI